MEPQLTNVNGFLVDSAGVIRGIEVPISDEPVTFFRRVARHESLTICANLQMIQRIRLIRLTASGVPLCDHVRELVVNPNVAAQLLNAYQDTFYPAQTEGAFVNSTGHVVEPDAEGAIEQLAFFQGMTIGIMKAMGNTITNSTSVIALVYGILKSELMNIDAQVRL